MTARTRVLATVGAAAVLAAGATVTATWLQSRGETTQRAGSDTKPRAGIPPLTFDFGVRRDAEARALDRGERLLRQGKRAAALQLFSRYRKRLKTGLVLTLRVTQGTSSATRTLRLR